MHLRRTQALMGVLALAAGGSAVAVPAFAKGKSKSVEVGDNYFVKDNNGATVSVSRGTKVEFEWEGNNPHNVTVTSGPQKFHSATLRGKGKHFNHVFTKPGTYTIVCTIHAAQGMKMKVRVT